MSKQVIVIIIILFV